MLVLDLLLDVAYHDGSARDLAVAAEAYTLAGYSDAAIMVSHSGTHDDLLARIQASRRGRRSNLLRHDAMGVLSAVQTLVREGIADGTEASRRQNERWKERGGYDR